MLSKRCVQIVRGEMESGSSEAEMTATTKHLVIGGEKKTPEVVTDEVHVCVCGICCLVFVQCER